MENTITLILAGGRCKRMDIFCRHQAKPALPFGGEGRLIDFALSNCLHSKCSSIAVLVDYHRISLELYLGRWITANGNTRNFHLLEPKYGAYQGNADAVYQNIDFLKKHPADLVLVIAGDAIYKMDYLKMIDFHRKSGAEATIGITSVPIAEAQRFGVTTVNNSSRVMSFLEKPEVPQSNLISMGIYVFNKHLLIRNLAEDAAISSSPHDFGHAIIPRMVRQNDVAAFMFHDYWSDTSTPQVYYDANMELLPKVSSLTISGSWPVLSEHNPMEPPRVFEKGSVQNSIISPGCVIKGQVLNSILSPGVWVDEDAVVRDSIIMSNSFVGYHSVVDHCILSEGVNVGRLCYLGFGGSVTRGEGVTVLGDQVTVPPHTAIGRNCKILPHAGLSDFKRNVVTSDTVLSPLPSHKSFGPDALLRGNNKRLQAFRTIE